MISILLTVTAPVFSLFALGVIFGRSGVLTKERTSGLVAFVIYIALPALLFKSLSRGFPELANAAGTVGAYVVATMIVYCSALGLAGLRYRCGKTERFLFAMGAAFPNSIMLGVPIVFAVFGEQGLVPLTVIILFNTVVLLGGTTLLVEIVESREVERTTRAIQTVRSVLLNPVIVGILAGLLWGYLKLPVGAYPEKLLTMLSGAVLPCGLVALGASVVGVKVSGNFSESAAITMLKLLAHPFAAWVVASYLFNLSNEARSLVVLVAALPVAGNVFVLAQKYQKYVDRMATSFILSTSLSMATITILIAIFERSII